MPERGNASSWERSALKFLLSVLATAAGTVWGGLILLRLAGSSARTTRDLLLSLIPAAILFVVGLCLIWRWRKSILAVGKAILAWGRWVAAIPTRAYNKRVEGRTRGVVSELLIKGFSASLKAIQTRRWHKRVIAYEHFMYYAASLRDGLHTRNMHPTDDAVLSVARGAARGPRARVFRQHSNKEGWAIWGPYCRLPRAGMYLVVFRLRCDFIGARPATQTVRLDVHRKGRPDVRLDRTLRSGPYEAIGIEFDYQEGDEVEFRVHPLPPGSGDVIADVISVVRLGDLEPPSVGDVPTGDAGRSNETGKLRGLSMLQGTWEVSYHPVGKRAGRETARIDREGRYYVGQKHAFNLEEVDFDPELGTLTFQKVRLDGSVYHAEELVLATPDRLEGHRKGCPEHTLLYVRAPG